MLKSDPAGPTGPPFSFAEARPDTKGPRRAGSLLAAIAIAAVLAFQAWTAWSTDPSPLFGGKRLDYNNRLMHSFLAGHLYLPYAPDPLLANAQDPFDPARRPAAATFIHDGSYYKGHFYLYFGVSPVVTLLLPWRLATGHDLPQVYEVTFFTGAGFLAASFLWLSLRRRYFPDSGPVVLVAGILVLGLGSMTHAVLRRSDLWEAAVAPGYCYAMLTLLCVHRSLCGRRKALWMAAAGVCFGLAVGSRPTYAVGAVAFAAPLLWIRRRGLPAALAAGVLPIAAALAWYNYARFGNPLEFGNHYMLNAADERAAVHFSLRYLPYNLYVYYLAPLSWSRYFPFAELIHSPRQPAGYYGIEFVCGLLVDFPVVWFALAAPAAWRRRPAAERGELRAWVVFAALQFAAVGAALACFWAATARYMVDFTPTLALLACVGMAAVEREVRGRWRTAAIGLGAAAAAFSAFTGAMLSFQLHELLRQLHPAVFARIAHAVDTPVSWIERTLGATFGSRELVVRFPKGRLGAIEPLVATGCEYRSDYLLVHYWDSSHVRLGFDHTGYGVLWSAPVPVDYELTHLVRIGMGSFFPPRAHPYYDGRPAAFGDQLTHSLFAAIDGRTVLSSLADFYDASPGSVAVGRDPAGIYPARFSGAILSTRLVPTLPPAPFSPGYGEIEMNLVLSGRNVGRLLPLVWAGEAGRGDLLRIREVRPGWVRFGYDHWWSGLRESPEIAMEDGVPHLLHLRIPSLMPPGFEPRALAESLLVEVDGRPCWLARPPSYRSDPALTSIGRNPDGATTSEPELPGGVVLATRVDPAEAVPPAALGPVVMELSFPEDGAGRTEPLLSVGRPGAADVVSVHYLAGGRVRFLLDHWGRGLHASRPVAVDPVAIHQVEIAMPSLLARAAGLQVGDIVVLVDGEPVWREKAEFYPAAPGTIAVAANPLGASTCGPEFSGALGRVLWNASSR